MIDLLFPLTLNNLLVISMNSKDILSYDPASAISLLLTQKQQYVTKLSSVEDDERSSDIESESDSCASD